MKIKVVECTQCDYTEKVVINNNYDYTCPKCNSATKINKIKTAKSINFERVPGGYDDITLNNIRHSEGGQLKEAEFLAGQSQSAY
jgi:Zn ribbon nucleic-acid-binding protein